MYRRLGSVPTKGSDLMIHVLNSRLFIWAVALSLLNVLVCACFEGGRGTSGEALCCLKSQDLRPSEGVFKTVEIGNESVANSGSAL